MNSPSFFAAAIPEPFTVLGLRLKPFSAGHLVLLHRIESAFVVGGIPALSDLVASVFICSLNFRDGIESLGSDEVDALMGKWQRDVGEFDFVEKCRLFARYIEEGSAEPAWFAPQGGGSIAVPKVQVVKVRLLSEFHMSEDEFLDRPWSLSLWDYYTLYALEGAIKLTEPGSIEEAQNVAQALAEKLNRKPCLN